MKRLIRSMVTGVVIVGIVLAAIAYSGVYNVGADVSHWPFTRPVVAWARDASIARHARDVVAPTDLDAADRIRRGAGNYAAMCARCHLQPGQMRSELQSGLDPQPPDLTRADAAANAPQQAARRFWIIKHGIQGSGMPAWSIAGVDDEAIWDLVALLQQLPVLSQADYLRLVESSEGHVHNGTNAHHHHDDDD